MDENLQVLVLLSTWLLPKGVAHTNFYGWGRHALHDNGLQRNGLQRDGLWRHKLLDKVL